MAVTLDQLEQLYLAYFGRPADFEGVQFYASDDSTATIEQVASTFAASAESKALYGDTPGIDFVTAIYQNLFGREPDLPGLAYWTKQIATGAVSPGGAALAILQGATDTDAKDLTMIHNKVLAATAFTNNLDTLAEVKGYAGQNAAALARQQLATVTADTATLTAYVDNVGNLINAVIGVGGNIGQTITLTTGVDTVNLSSNATTIDTVKGVIELGGLPGSLGSSTYTAGDTITGNGKTILDLAVTASGLFPGGTQAPFATLKDIKSVNITNAAGSGSMSFDAVSWTNVGSVNLNAGADGMVIGLAHLGAGTGLSVGAGVAGAIQASYTNEMGVGISSDKGSMISEAGGWFVGQADKGGVLAGTAVALANATNITVGDVTFAAAGNDGASASFRAYNTGMNTTGGDITVGNVSITGFTSSITFSAGNTGHVATDKAHNVTVGNVTLTGVDAATVNLSVGNSNTSGAVEGNVTVGNIALAVGDTGTIHAQIGNNGTAMATPGKSVGNVAVGSVTAVVGASGAADIHVTNYASNATTKDVTVGDTSVASVGFNIGQSSDFTLDANVWAFANSGDATIGNVTIGGVGGVLGQSADASVTVSVSAQSVAGAATIGNVAVAAGDYTLGVGAQVNNHYYITASATHQATTGAYDQAATIGTVALGSLTVNAGIDTAFTEYRYVEAIGSTESAIGDVTVGDFDLKGDDGAYIYVYTNVSSDGTLGNVTAGNTSVELGVSATADLYSYFTGASVGDVTVGDVNVTGGDNSTFFGSFTASGWSGDLGNVTVGDLNLATGKSGAATFSYEFSASNDIGNITIGNINLDAKADGAYVYASIDASAWNGAIGTVSVGDVTVSAGKSATATFSLGFSGETAIGDVSFGNVAINAVGDSASAKVEATIENDGSGKLGNMTFGNVKLDVNGAGAFGQFYASMSSADTGGKLTVGNIDLSVTSGAKATGAIAEVTIDNTLDAVVVGDITLNAAGVRTATDTTIAYDANVSITAEKGITIGTIKVTGGDGKAEDFGTLSNWLSTSTTTGGVKVAGVDYSGYGAAATIDISGFSGNTSVVGTAKDDTITDNKGANTLTGGAGADTFTFLTTNTGKTLTTIDTITDFSDKAGDKIALSLTGGALDTTRYGEATYSDFSAFVTGANAADKAVWVGQVGGDSYVAVDYNEDHTVDYVIKLVGVTTATINVGDFV